MLNTRKFDSITPVLQELRWLPASYYLMYTVGVLAFECAKGLAPSYLSDRFVDIPLTQKLSSREIWYPGNEVGLSQFDKLRQR